MRTYTEDELNKIHADNIEFICEEIQNSSWHYSEYCEYILNNCGGDRIVLDDDLPDVAGEGYLIESYAETLLAKIESGSLLPPPKLLSKLNLHPNAVKRFKAYWGDNFVTSGETIITSDFVCALRGYSTDEIIAVNLLSVGETWTSRHYADHTITRIS